VKIPGPRSRALVPRLRAHESQNVTYVADDFPVFWESAAGATVVDVDGNAYVDLTAAFGVANAGHANPAVVTAIAGQAARLMHGMGDVFPTETRVRLMERLAVHAPPGLRTAFLATTGHEAVEAALKTAVLFTGKPRFAAYRGGYHGLSLGTLPLCGVDRFVTPFAGAIAQRAVALDFPRQTHDAGDALARAHAALSAHGDLAAVVIEPIQARGGCVIPPDGYLAGLRQLCDDLGILMIVDEIYTGFGRTGSWFAVERDGVVPDLLCVGKALANGFPIGALLGRPAVMDAWPPSEGEALHTSTYLGNPMGCAAALATIAEHERLDLARTAQRFGSLLSARLDALRPLSAVLDVRGRGMLWGVQLRDGPTASRAVRRALASGAMLLQSGPEGEVLSIAPPLVIGEADLHRGLDVVETTLAGLG